MRFWPRCCLLLVVMTGFAAEVAAQELRVVTVTRTPFSHVENGANTGFSLQLWDAIATELGLEYRIDRLDDFAEMLSEVESGRADLAAANISITASREARLDFSQPIFSSGLRVMVPEDLNEASVASILWSRDLLLALLAAFALLLGGGMLMWRFERGQQEYFEGTAREKMFPAFWWALNLVVNGGFEERVPRTALGRVFGTILVVSSLFVVSVFVAKITSAMTVNAIQNSVQSLNDLYGKEVGTTRGSTAATFMDGRDMPYRGFANLDDLLRAFEGAELQAVVFDTPILSYYVNTKGQGIGALVGPTFQRENYGFALPTDSALREDIDRTLLRLREDGTYRSIYVTWFGSEDPG